MLKLNPYLNFNGNTRIAFEFYSRLLGGKLDMQTFGESPMADQTDPDWRDKIVHARLTIGDAVLMASDAPDGRYHQPQGMMVSLQVDTAAEADRIFTALAEGGEVSMPIQETFWAERFGMCVDRFGIPWMVNCDKAMVPA
jgi:PhnB protein